MWGFVITLNLLPDYGIRVACLVANGDWLRSHADFWLIIGVTRRQAFVLFKGLLKIYGNDSGFESHL